MEGVKIRSRVRWISDEEKATKCFCNLEKRNFVSKCMNSLIKENGSITNVQSELLQETIIFYKKLYTKKDRREVNLNLLLNEFNIPKVKACDKVKLEGHITYSEMIYCLKESSNNTSPGFDGFTYEFFKFFLEGCRTVFTESSQRFLF